MPGVQKALNEDKKRSWEFLATKTFVPRMEMPITRVLISEKRNAHEVPQVKAQARPVRGVRHEGSGITGSERSGMVYCHKCQ